MALTKPPLPSGGARSQRVGVRVSSAEISGKSALILAFSQGGEGILELK